MKVVSDVVFGNDPPFSFIVLQALTSFSPMHTSVILNKRNRLEKKLYK